VEVIDGTKAIDAFLDVMAFASNADRTNAVALALTVLLRNFWPGAPNRSASSRAQKATAARTPSSNS
jgi:hypothetical protein